MSEIEFDAQTIAELRDGLKASCSVRDGLDLQASLKALDTIESLRARVTALEAHIQTVLHAAGQEAMRTGFTLTPEQGLGQIINECCFALGMTPWSREEES